MDLGCRVWAVGFGVWGFGFRVLNLGFRVLDVGFGVLGVGSIRATAIFDGCLLHMDGQYRG